MTHDLNEKLIRDRIGERIKANGDGQVRLADDAEMAALLDRKLDEEIAELRASGFTDVREFADVMEVLLALAERHGFRPRDIAACGERKRKEAGGFAMGYVLKM